jgi:dTMP kinase
MFVTFEGIDGSGKTTQAALLGEWAREQGHEVVAVREPGGTAAGERIRELLLAGPELAPWTEAALFAAARAELAERVLRPALERGAWVVCDRYVDSSLAYQGAARGLGIAEVHELNRAVVGGLEPDVTFVLLVDPELALRRRGEGRDRIEREAGDFVRRVDRGYRELVALFPERIVAVDGARAPEEVAFEIRGEAAARARRAAEAPA